MKYKDIEFIEREKCCICGCDDLRFESNIYDYDSYIGEFKLIKCPKCGMYYTSPYPTASTLPNLYKLRDTKNFDEDNSLFFDWLKSLLAKIQISGFFSNSDSAKNLKIVDFGCGNGRYALAFQKVFPNMTVCAVDFMTTPPKDFLNSTEKTPQYLSTENFYKSNEKYDIIFLRHVVEHVENPKLFLQIMLDKLTETGYIHIEVPNIHNGLKLFFNKYLPSYYPPYHLVHFTKYNMINLLKELNVEYEIKYMEMPIMSNVVANMCHTKLNNWHRILGVFLHPLQLILCFRKHTVIVADIRKHK